MKAFTDLTEREALALAISNEEEDGRLYADFAHSLREEFPETAQMFVDMAAEENEHRRQLIDLFVNRFGDAIPLVRRRDVRGSVALRPAWRAGPRACDTVRGDARHLEAA